MGWRTGVPLGLVGVVVVGGSIGGRVQRGATGRKGKGKGKMKNFSKKKG
jgi:hypothetical protein